MTEKSIVRICLLLQVSPAVGILPRELPTEMREQLEDAGLYPKHRQGILKKGKAVEKNTVKNGVEKEEVNVEVSKSASPFKKEKRYHYCTNNRS